MWLYIEWLDGQSEEIAVNENVVLNHKLGYVSRGITDNLLYIEDRIINLNAVRYVELITEKENEEDAEKK